MLGAALAVLVLLFGAFTVRQLGRPPGGAAFARLTASTDTVSIDRGRVGRAAVAGCVDHRFASHASEVEVRYGVRQLAGGGTSPVLVLRNRAGELRLCDELGPDSPAVLPLPHATARHPVVYLSSGRRHWVCEGNSGRVRSFTMTEWLATTPRVHRALLRFVVDGSPGSWYATRVRHGIAHFQVTLSGPYPKHTRYAVQQRFFDRSGHRVRSAVVPARQVLPGCTHAGSAEIG